MNISQRSCDSTCQRLTSLPRKNGLIISDEFSSCLIFKLKEKIPARFDEVTGSELVNRVMLTASQPPLFGAE